MYKMTRNKQYVLTAICITLCCVLPMMLHAFYGAGSIVLPMHIPVLLCGLVVGWKFGILAGIFGPLLSSFVTGMPTMAYAPVMVVELATYGAIVGLLICIIHTKNQYFNIYAALIPAMLVGRVVAGVFRAVFFLPELQTGVVAWVVSSYFVTSAPGIIIQLILIPAIVVALEKARIVRR